VILLDGVVVYSASDLAVAAGCEYALLRSFDARLGRGPRVQTDDELLARTALLGGEHEQRHLDKLRAQISEEPTVIGRPAYSRAAFTAAAEQTRDAVQRRAPVIVQAAMFDGRFLGFGDFLLLEGNAYRLRDTKLARSVKVTALLQLAAYADALRQDGVSIHDEVELALGNDTMESYPVGELLPVYRSRRQALQDLLDRHYTGGAPVQWGDESVRACLRCPECQVQINATNDVLLVAGLRNTQRARLIDAGITTIHQLAEHDGAIAGLSAAMGDKLRLQARLQTSKPGAGGVPALPFHAGGVPRLNVPQFTSPDSWLTARTSTLAPMLAPFCTPRTAETLILPSTGGPETLGVKSLRRMERSMDGHVPKLNTLNTHRMLLSGV